MTLPARRPSIAVGLRNWPRTRPRAGRCSPRTKVPFTNNKRTNKFPCSREPPMPAMHPPRQSRRPLASTLAPSAASPPPPPPLPPPPPASPATCRNGATRAASWSSTWPASAWPVPVAGLLLSWQPNRSITRRTAHIAREVYSAWRGRVGNATCAPSDKVLLLLGDLHLQPNTSQVHKMLHSCDPNGTASHSPRSQSFLTFNEFCILVTELKRCYDKGSPQGHSCRRSNAAEKSCHGLNGSVVNITAPSANSRECRASEGKDHPQRRTSKAVPKCEVFLGGSCNPTTWRKDVAIPLLEKLSISYYNPQVANWEPHLVELEHRAKQNASVLFFVIDKLTRNVSATVEVAYYSGLRRNLILVLKPYDGRGCKIGKDLISEKELQDLKHGQLLMQHLVERQGVPVFSSIPMALSCTSKVLRDNISVQDLAVSDVIQSSKESYDSLSDSILELRETFNAFDTRGTGKIPLSDVCLACGILRNRNVSLAELQALIVNNSGILGKDTRGESVENNGVGFDEFCSIVAELKSSLEKWGLKPMRNPSPMRNQIFGVRDVFLGGIDSDSTWTEEIAIPILKKNGLSYFSSPACDSSQWRPPLLAMDNSRVLIFVVSDRKRALSTMTLAAHYIGLGCKVVLCVQLLKEGTVVDGERLSEDALKDYNRGRKYLIDLANKEKVPVFDNVKSALDCVVSKCLSHYRQKALEKADD